MMGKFGFSKSRKKPPAQLALSEPMSKAHKILGSTPLNIDSPKLWDDGSSSFSAGTVSTVPSHLGTEDGISDHEVAIARSDGDWVSEFGLLPTVVESASLDDLDSLSRTDPVGLLRKSQSSSTIKSRYDQSTHLAIAQQTASFANAKGLSTTSQPLTIVDDIPGTAHRTKKKPPKLDLIPNRRLSRKSSTPQLYTDCAIVGAPDSSLKSPSLFSLLTPTTDHHREARRIQKRLTKDRPPPPIIESPRPKTSETASSHVTGSSSRGVPSLYDHYEQMMDRQLALDEAAYEQANEESDARDVVSRDSEISHSTHTTSQESWSPRQTQATPSSPHRTSTRASKHSDSVNLQQSSILMLSESESDGDDTPQQVSFSRQSVSAPVQPASARSSAQQYHRSSRASHSSRPSKSILDHSGGRSSRASKRASFAPANTYISIPNNGTTSEDNGIVSNHGSRANTPFDSRAGTPSYRASLISNYSVQSTGEWIHEAKAVQLLPARRPSRVVIDDDANNGSHSSQSVRNGARANSDASSDDETTSSSLSQTSVEFFLRSAHSSVDGSGVHGRIMAVSREEEQLLESLRYKQKEAQERAAAADALSSDGRMENASTAKSVASDADSIQDQASTYEFEFPAPPSAKRDSFGVPNRRSLSMRVRASASVDKSQFATINEEEDATNESQRRNSSASSPQRQQPLKGILKKSTNSLPAQDSILEHMEGEDAESELDDFSEFDYLAPQTFEPQTFVADASPKPTSGFSPKSPDDMEFLPCTRYGEPVADGTKFRSTRESLNAGTPETSTNTSSSAACDSTDEPAGVPRPDSPISPDAFPSVPQVRTTLSSIARLSAVGPVRGSGTPGWWGDED